MLDYPIWTYDNISDPKFLDNLIPISAELTGKVIVEFSDGKICAGIRMAFLNLFWWPILLAFGIAIRKEHFIKRLPPNKDNLADAWNIYYQEIMALDNHNAEKLSKVAWDVIQHIYSVSSTYLLPYVSSLDMMDLAAITLDPHIAKLLESKDEILSPNISTRTMEMSINQKNKEIATILGTPGLLQNEALLPYQRVKQLNTFQLPQTIYAFGIRTDINDTIISYPVIGSAIDGLRNILEFGVESLSAKKSASYNHNAVSISQYFGRKEHLITLTLQRIYPGDCGSKVTIKFFITEKNAKNVIGSYIYENGELKLLTKGNINHYVNTEVNLRNPLGCKYRNGVCEKCGGALLTNINPNINIGMLSSIQLVKKVSQGILSAKHLIRTTSVFYQMPAGLEKILYQSSNNEIRWNKEFHSQLENYMMGIDVKNFSSVHDIHLLSIEKDIREEKMSNIRAFVLRDKYNNKTAYNLFSNEQCPFLSKEMILYLRQNASEIKIEDDIAWLPIHDTERIPIFRTTVVNDSLLALMDRVKNFLEKDISRYTNCSKALQKFMDTVEGKVDINIIHVGIVLKAYTITSDTDFSVPRIEDPNHVKFQNLPTILVNRNVGTELAFQWLTKYVVNPNTYLVKHSKSQCDLMIGYHDY